MLTRESDSRSEKEEEWARREQTGTDKGGQENLSGTTEKPASACV